MLHRRNLKFYHIAALSWSDRNTIFGEENPCSIITLNRKLLNSAGVSGNLGLLCPCASISKDFERCSVISGIYIHLHLWAFEGFLINTCSTEKIGIRERPVESSKGILRKKNIFDCVLPTTDVVQIISLEDHEAFMSN